MAIQNISYQRSFLRRQNGTQIAKASMDPYKMTKITIKYLFLHFQAQKKHYTSENKLKLRLGMNKIYKIKFNSKKMQMPPM